MAPSAIAQRRTHNLLLFQKLLNLRDGASPFTLLLDTLEQSSQPVVREFVTRAKVSQIAEPALFFMCNCYDFTGRFVFAMYCQYERCAVVDVQGACCLPGFSWHVYWSPYRLPNQKSYMYHFRLSSRLHRSTWSSGHMESHWQLSSRRFWRTCLRHLVLLCHHRVPVSPELPIHLGVD